MNPDTGYIHFKPAIEEIQTKKLVPIPENEIEQVVNMNRKQRRAWAAQQRRAQK